MFIKEKFHPWFPDNIVGGTLQSILVTQSIAGYFLNYRYLALTLFSAWLTHSLWSKSLLLLLHGKNWVSLCKKLSEIKKSPTVFFRNFLTLMHQLLLLCSNCVLQLCWFATLPLLQLKKLTSLSTLSEGAFSTLECPPGLDSVIFWEDLLLITQIPNSSALICWLSSFFLYFF